MTLHEIKQSDKPFLIPTDIAGLLGCDPQNIRLMARQRPELLGFPVCVMGTRVRIPRVPFVSFVEGRSCKGGKETGG